MKITDMACVRGFMQMAQDGVDMGWHEKNGGNLSYRMTAEEAAKAKKAIGAAKAGEWFPIGETVPKLGGMFFIVTGTTRYLRNVPRDPENAFGIVELDKAGVNYRIRWGLANGGRPTSEFPSHLKNHEVKMLATDGKNHVIYHAHPAHLIALTFVLPPTDKAFTRALWEIMTECPVIFPKGIGVIPWMVPGKGPIAGLTSKLMQRYDIVVWAQHGLFCAGATFDEAFGLMETVEKASEILLYVMSSGKPRLQTITPDGIRQIAKAYNLPLDESFLKD